MKEAVSSELDPPRLLGGGSTLERRLLESARWDAAPPGARAHMAEALAPVLVDPPAAAAGASEHARGKWLHAMPTPRTALLGLTGAGIATYLLASLLSQPAAAPYHAAEEAPLAPLADEEPLATGRALSDGALAAAPKTDLAEGAPVLKDPAPQRQHRAPSVMSERRARATAKPAQPPSSGTLLEEVRLLDTVRAALRTGELQTAEHTLRSYDQRFPSGELHNEKSVLAVELLLARGEVAAARESARRLLEQPGMQRYAPHLRAILDSHGDRAPESGSDTAADHIRARR